MNQNENVWNPQPLLPHEKILCMLNENENEGGDMMGGVNQEHIEREGSEEDEKIHDLDQRANVNYLKEMEQEEEEEEEEEETQGKLISI